MKRLFLFLLILLPVFTARGGTYRIDQIPNVQLSDATRYTSNPDGILSADAVAQIDQLCTTLRQQGLAEVVVVAVDEIDGADVFDFAYELFSLWGVGDKETNNGLLILLVKDRREIRFVTGYGLEGALPDALCKRIQTERMLPAFRDGDYSRGVVRGVDTVASVLRDGGYSSEGSGTDYDSGESGYDTSASNNRGLSFWGWVILGIVLIPFVTTFSGWFVYLFVILVHALCGNRKLKLCPQCGAYKLKRISKRTIKTTSEYRLIEYDYICRACGCEAIRRLKEPIYRGSGGSSRSGSGGSSHSGGSHGGGRSGGGGSGSRW